MNSFDIINVVIVEKINNIFMLDQNKTSLGTQDFHPKKKMKVTQVFKGEPLSERVDDLIEKTCVVVDDNDITNVEKKKDNVCLEERMKKDVSD